MPPSELVLASVLLVLLNTSTTNIKMLLNLAQALDPELPPALAHQQHPLVLLLLQLVLTAKTG
jgi:hypothetical protein